MSPSHFLPQQVFIFFFCFDSLSSKLPKEEFHYCFFLVVVVDDDDEVASDATVATSTVTDDGVVVDSTNSSGRGWAPFEFFSSHFGGRHPLAWWHQRLPDCGLEEGIVKGKDLEEEPDGFALSSCFLNSRSFLNSHSLDLYIYF